MGSEVRAFSRNLEDHSEMFPEIVEGIRTQLKRHDVILDGEAPGVDPSTAEFVPFQQTVTRKRQHDIDQAREALPLKLLTFDLLYLDGEDQSQLPYSQPRPRLPHLLGKAIDFAAPGAAATGPVVQPNEVRTVETAEDVEAYFATTVERGQEGLVAKRLDAPYEAGAR